MFLQGGDELLSPPADLVGDLVERLVFVRARIRPGIVPVRLGIEADAHAIGALDGQRKQFHVLRDDLPLVVVEPVHLPLVGGVEGQEVVRELLPLDLGERVQLGLEIGLIPRPHVEHVVEAFRAKDEALERPLLHLADVVPHEVRVGHVPAILDDLLLEPRLGQQTVRGQARQGERQDDEQNVFPEHRQTLVWDSTVST